MSTSMVRDAVVADAAAIARVHVRTWQGAYRGIVPDSVLDGLSVDEREQRWRQILADPGPGFTVVAETERGVEGFCTGLCPSRDDDAGARTGEIAALYVEPSRWRGGVGRLLLTEVLGRLQGHGCLEVTAWVLAENAGGRRFYQRLGFGADRAEANHEGSGQIQVRLRAPPQSVERSATP